MKPGRDTGQRFHAMFADEIAIEFLLRGRDFLNAFRSRRNTKPPRDDRIVSLSERSEKLFASDGNILIRHCVPPGDPVELLRVNQCSIHIPKYGTDYAHC